MSLNGSAPRFYAVEYRGGYIIRDRRDMWEWQAGRPPFPTMKAAQAEIARMESVFCQRMGVDEWPK